MRTKNSSEDIKLVKLFFDPQDQSGKLAFPRICTFIRQVFNVTQIEMAEKLGVTPTGYRSWEAGRREPSSKAAFNLCLMYLQAIQLKKIKDQLGKPDLLPELDKNNPYDELTLWIQDTENNSVNAA